MNQTGKDAKRTNQTNKPKRIKTREERMRELRIALLAMDMSLGSFRQNAGNEQASAFLLQLHAPLRNLVATGGPNFKPLLTGLAEELELALKFYALPNWGLALRIEMGESQENKTIFSPTSFVPAYLCRSVCSSHAQEGYLQRELGEWMLDEVYRTKEQCFTRNDLLRIITDKYGGGHIDPDHDSLALFLNDFLFLANPQNQTAQHSAREIYIYHLGNLVCWLGFRFLAKYRSVAGEIGDEQLKTEIKALDKYFDRNSQLSWDRILVVVPPGNTWPLDKRPQSGRIQLRVKLSTDPNWHDQADAYCILDHEF